MSLKFKTLTPRKEDGEQTWYLIDGTGQTVGRLAAFISETLRGKHRPDYAPHVNFNIHVVVTNTKDLVFTGNKMKTQKYYRHTGYPGGIREATAQQLQEKKPGEILVHAVRGMVPHNRLGRALMKNLRIFPGPDHNHAAQLPVPLDVRTR